MTYENIAEGWLDDLDGIAWYNGQSVQWRDATVHPLSHGLLHGAVLWDGIRVYNRKVFRLSKHIERFLRDAKELNIDLPYNQKDLEDAVNLVVSERQIELGYVRPEAWLGPGFMDVSPVRNRNLANAAIFAWPLDVFANEGTRLILSKVKRYAPDTGPWQLKASGNYLPASLQKRRAKDLGFGDALFLDWKGNVADVTGANIFLAIDGVLHTPEPQGFFSGLTRQAVMELAKTDGVQVVVREIPVAELRNAQEVFMTGTATGIVSVGHIDLEDGNPINYEPQGPRTRRLQEQYEELKLA